MNRIRELKIFHFEVLDAVERKGTLTAAAKALGVSKGQVSKSLTEYEGLLGYKLFKRDTRNVNITPAGARLIVSVRALLRFCHARHDAAAAIAHARTRKRRGTIARDLEEHLRDMGRSPEL